MYQVGLGRGAKSPERRGRPPSPQANSSTPMSPTLLIVLTMQISPQHKGGPGPNRPKRNLHAQREPGEEKKKWNGKRHGTALMSNINMGAITRRTRRNKFDLEKAQDTSAKAKHLP